MAVNNSSKELHICWLITIGALILLICYMAIAFAYGAKLQANYAIAEQQRLWLRSACYALAIIAFPIVNLIRHIQLRLNQTMPGLATARQRYQITILVSMGLIQVSGMLGLLMYILGDQANTLNILTGMSALGVYLYRPKYNEFLIIVDALVEKQV